ncbi:MAG TPA: ABC transporter ATP-binding protein [Opitutaceae bacterium]|nr:ABC transporter ATP-binding protein [Opitutaceae bacterium]
MRRFFPYFKYVKPVRLALIGGILCGILYGAANGLGIPLMVEYVFPRVLLPDGPAAPSPAVPARHHFIDIDKFFERILPARTPPRMAGSPAAVSAAPAPPAVTGWRIWAIALWLPIIFVLRGLAGYFNTYLIQYAGVRILEEIRTDYFATLQRLPLAFFQRLSTGELIARGLNDTNQLQNTLTLIANDLIKQPATLVSTICAVALLAYNEQGVLLVLMCLLTVPLAVFPIRYVGKKLVARAIQLQAQTGTITDRLTENLAAVKEVRAFALEAKEIGRFRQLAQQLVRAQMKVVKYAQALNPSIEILSAIGISITFVYAYRANVHSGAFLGILAALYMSYDPLKRLGGVNNELKRGEASLLRLEEVLNEPITIADPPHPEPVGRLQGNIAFDHVSFEYKAETPVLRDVQERIPAGTVCALVGPSGAGKTTFANLVPRFYDVTAGRLAIDGIDVRAMRFSDLRRNIALVSQDPVLFNDSIYNNLLIGRPDATRAEVVAAARSAHAHEFITAFPQGYETSAGERGSRLSGGQKQRLAIARAFLRNAPILILDEATSALDSESEAAVQAALKELMIGKTVLIIAHRFSTIRDASLILVFHEGRVVARGSHPELYATNGLYRALYDRQHAAPDQRADPDVPLRPLSL